MNQMQFQKAAGISAGLAARRFPPQHSAAMKESLCLTATRSIGQCSLPSAAAKPSGLPGTVESFNRCARQGFAPGGCSLRPGFNAGSANSTRA